MAFTPKTWADGAAGETPITAAELNRVEAGIEEAHDEIATLPAPLALGTTASTAAAGNHTHTIANVTGLQAALDAKATAAALTALEARVATLEAE